MFWGGGGCGGGKASPFAILLTKSHCRVVCADGLLGVLCNLHGASSISLNVYLGLHLSLWPHIWSHLPTASCSRWIFFILNSGHLPTAILSIWLLILALAIVLLVVAVVAVVLSSFLPTEALVPRVRLWS